MNVGEAFVTIQNIWFALEGLQVLSQMSIKNAQVYYISFINKIKREKEIWVIRTLTFLQLLETSLSCSFQEMMDRQRTLHRIVIHGVVQTPFQTIVTLYLVQQIKPNFLSDHTGLFLSEHQGHSLPEKMWSQQ